MQVAAELSDRFADGVFFVNLAPLSDPALVVPTIAQTLDLKETGEQPLLDLLKAYLQDKQLLLLLDNFEQVLGAAVQVADLLVRLPTAQSAGDQPRDAACARPSRVCRSTTSTARSQTPAGSGGALPV